MPPIGRLPIFYKFGVWPPRRNAPSTLLSSPLSLQEPSKLILEQSPNLLHTHTRSNRQLKLQPRLDGVEEARGDGPGSRGRDGATVGLGGEDDGDTGGEGGFDVGLGDVGGGASAGSFEGGGVASASAMGLSEGVAHLR